MQYDPSLQRPLQAELKAGEQLLWAGRPNPVRVMLPWFLLWLFAIPWTLHSIDWMKGWGESWNPLSLHAVPILWGIGMMGYPFWAYGKATRTIYGITNLRVILMVKGLKWEVQSFRGPDLNHVVCKEWANGSGHLTFAKREPEAGSDDYTREYAFIGIPKVREVERLLRGVLLKEASD